MQPSRLALLLFVYSILSSNLLPAQCIAPVSDLTNQQYLWDNGNRVFLEALQPKTIVTGKNYLAWVNYNGSRSKLYYGGKTYNLCDNDAELWRTDNWFVYKNFSNLVVLFDNKLTSIDRLAYPEYWVSDSLIVWNSTLGQVRYFYNGINEQLEAFPLQDLTPEDGQVSNGKIGDNIFAYVDQSNNFKVLYHGQKITLETYVPQNYVVDRDMVMYIDYNGNFKFFYKGQSVETTINNINSYWTGERFLAYYNLQGQLTVWYNGEEKTLSQDRPKSMLVRENMIAFVDQGNNFYVWYNGTLTLLDRNPVSNYKIDNDILVYQDQYGRLQGFYYGKKVEVSDQIVSSYNLYNETVTYQLVRGEIKIWCAGNTDTFIQ
ncbi:MAG: hypothetical protein U0T73_01545 [Chitinophagales bacterium]